VVAKVLLPLTTKVLPTVALAVTATPLAAFKVIPPAAETKLSEVAPVPC